MNQSPDDLSTTPRWVYLLIAGAVFVTFAPLLNADFTKWDDPHTVFDNVLLNPVRSDTWEYYWTNPAARIYIPLTYTVWAALSFVSRVSPDHQGITLNPTWYHLASLCFHAGSAIAVFCVLRRLTGSLMASALGALVFAVHPVQTESVGWISGLKDVLAGFFSCWAVYALVRLRQAGESGQKWVWIGMLITMQVLAILSKPSAMTLALVVAAVDFLALRTSMRKVVTTAALLLIVVAPFAVVARLAQIPIVSGEVPIWIRPAIAMDSVAFYLGKIVWPAVLVIDYGRRPQWVIASGWLFVTPVITGLVIVGLVLAYRRGQRLIACAGAVFVLAPLHVLGLARFDFQQYSTTADHYLYFAMLGPAIAVAWALNNIPSLKWIGIVCICALAVRSFWQSTVWYNDHTLMSHALRHNPDSPVALNNLSVHLVEQGYVAEAKAGWQRVIELDPATITARLNLARLEVKEGRISEARAVFNDLLVTVERTLRNPQAAKADAYMGIINVCLSAGNTSEALHWLQKAEAFSPNDPRLERVRSQLLMLPKR